MEDTSTRVTPKTDAPVKTQNNAFDADSVAGLTSPKIVTRLTGSVLYNAKAGVSSANNMKCIMTTSQRHVRTRDDI